MGAIGLVLDLCAVLVKLGRWLLGFTKPKAKPSLVRYCPQCGWWAPLDENAER
ncbi:hypothetical protein MCP1_20229 [Candidatus Terasakiella magnetica]|nr:hypothetical protein MCP1_20229 [Candidatus Terasakiella magnetica]